MARTVKIESVSPSAAISGGDILIRGQGFDPSKHVRPRVKFGDREGSVVVAAADFLLARVPDGATHGQIRIAADGMESAPYPFSLGVQIADSLHPVANPAIDRQGNIYATFSGARGQKVPVSVYLIDPSYRVKPFVTEMMNPTGLAFSSDGHLHVSSRFDGTIYRIDPEGHSTVFAEGMGVATGIAFDRHGFLYVGDRSGTLFKIGPDRKTFVFATLEPSIAAYHLAFNAEGDLFVTGPTTSSYDAIYRVTPAGEVSRFYRGLGRPQGLAFDKAGNLYVAASLAGRRGIVCLTPNAKAELVVSGPGVVGMAFLPNRRLILATNSALFHLDWNVEGLPLLS
jgi:sugar lactone lactonase YvrE